MVGKLIERMLFWGDDLVYLPKDSTIQIHAAIERPMDMVLPSQVVEHFIEQATTLDHELLPVPGQQPL